MPTSTARYEARPPDVAADPMIARRRTWLYRLPGQQYAQTVSFDRRVTAVKARQFLRRKVGNPLELWARSVSDVKQSS